MEEELHVQNVLFLFADFVRDHGLPTLDLPANELTIPINCAQRIRSKQLQGIMMIMPWPRMQLMRGHVLDAVCGLVGYTVVTTWFACAELSGVMFVNAVGASDIIHVLIKQDRIMPRMATLLEMTLVVSFHKTCVITCLSFS